MKTGEDEGQSGKEKPDFAALELERREGKKSYMNGGIFFGSLKFGEIDVLGASAQAQPNGFGASSAERLRRKLSRSILIC